MKTYGDACVRFSDDGNDNDGYNDNNDGDNDSDYDGDEDVVYNASINSFPQGVTQ